MELFKKNKKAFMIGAVALIGLVVWYLYFRKPEEGTAATAKNSGTPGTSATGDLTATVKSMPFTKANSVPKMLAGNPYFGKLQLIVAYPHIFAVGETVKITSSGGAYSGEHEITYIYNNAASKLSALYFMDIDFTVNDTGTVTRY